MIWREQFPLRCFWAWEAVSFTYSYMFRNPTQVARKIVNYFGILVVQPSLTISQVSHVGPSPSKAGDFGASIPAAVASRLQSKSL